MHLCGAGMTSVCLHEGFCAEVSCTQARLVGASMNGVTLYVVSAVMN